MFDLPFHPIVVHFPIALGVLVPVMGMFLIWAMSSKRANAKSWGIMVFITALYLASAVGAVKTGELDEHNAEELIGRSLVHDHEEAGEKVPWAAGILFVSCLVTYAISRNKLSWTHKLVTLLAIAGLYPLLYAGETGGKLVYEQGAARIHWNSSSLPEKHEFVPKDAPVEPKKDEKND